MTDIWTAQYRYSGADRLDITVKGNHPVGGVFAPTWEMVGRLMKNVPESQLYYVNSYRELIKERLSKDDSALMWVLAQKELTFVCFCSPGAFCHRVLLARDMLHGVVNYRGERKV